MDTGASAAPPAGEERDPRPPPGPPVERRRLYREPEDRKLAGICGGLADYTGVDPALVRAGAVLLAVTMPATVIVYLVAIFAIEERPSTVARVLAPPVEVVERHRWLPLAVIAVAVFVVAGGPAWWWPDVDVPLIGLLLVGLGVWLLARGREGPPDGGPVPGPGSPPADQGSDEAPGPPGEFPPPTPPAPTPPAWSGPEAPPVPPAPPVGPAGPAGPAGGAASERLGLVVTAVVLIGGGVVWLLYVTDAAELDPRDALAAGLLVVGLGLVVAAWWGRARAVLIPLGLVAVAVLGSAEVLDVPLDAGVGDRTVVVTRQSQLGEPMELLMGELVVDLRDAPLSARRPAEVRAGLGIGELQVLVPREAEVVVHADLRAGSVGGVLAPDGAGGDSGAPIEETYTLAGREGAPRLDLDLDVGFGRLEVIRG